jgi:IS30 family transposase
MEERKSVYGVMVKVVNKTSDIFGSSIVDKLKPLAARMKTVPIENIREYAEHGQIYEYY